MASSRGLVPVKHLQGEASFNSQTGTVVSSGFVTTLPWAVGVCACAVLRGERFISLLQRARPPTAGTDGPEMLRVAKVALADQMWS